MTYVPRSPARRDLLLQVSGQVCEGIYQSPEVDSDGIDEVLVTVFTDTQPEPTFAVQVREHAITDDTGAGDYSNFINIPVTTVAAGPAGTWGAAWVATAKVQLTAAYFQLVVGNGTSTPFTFDASIRVNKTLDLRLGLI